MMILVRPCSFHIFECFLSAGPDSAPDAVAVGGVVSSPLRVHRGDVGNPKTLQPYNPTTLKRARGSHRAHRARRRWSGACPGPSRRVGKPQIPKPPKPQTRAPMYALTTGADVRAQM
eukprot:334275-Prorocentrum_minimum.AAC.2